VSASDPTNGSACFAIRAYAYDTGSPWPASPTGTDKVIIEAMIATEGMHGDEGAKKVEAAVSSAHGLKQVKADLQNSRGTAIFEVGSQMLQRYTKSCSTPVTAERRQRRGIGPAWQGEARDAPPVHSISKERLISSIVLG
jgi:hypothetical protein